MNLLTTINSNPLQQQTVALPNGNTFVMTLYFVPLQLGWFITSLSYQTFTLQGLRIVNNPNLLYQWQNLLPFGLGCFSPSQREPTQQQDFSSGNSNLYVLTQAECKAYAAYIRGGSLPS